MAGVGRLVKESIVEELSAHLAERPNVFVTSMTRLPASEADALRQKLHQSQARLVMINRRLGRRAVEPLKIPGLTDLLEGSVGLVLVGENFLPAAKQIHEFWKTHGEQLWIKGALVDGQLLDAKRVEELANLPPKPVLLAQVAATIESPIAAVIATIERLLGDVAWLLERAAEKTQGDPTKEGT